MNEENAKRIVEAQEKVADAISKEPTVISFTRRCQEVWVRAWVAVASTESSNRPEMCSAWADKCVEDFKKKFGEDK
jgi:hypothetical protein